MSEPTAAPSSPSRPWLVSRMARAIATISAGVVLAASFAAVPAQAVEPAVTPGTLPETVSADLLVAPQINGVVWSTAVDGNTAYAVGSFTRARPAGVPAGGAGEVVRNNAMAFNIDTGAILPWNPDLNAQARVIELTSDRKQLFIGGDFTVVGGQARSKIASFTTATGALDANFKSSVSGSVYGIAVTADRVFFGGSFANAGGGTRSNVAAVARTTGALLPWAPATDGMVQSIVAAQDNSRVVLGGRFQQLNGARQIGIGAVDGVSGASQAWSSTPIPAAAGTSSSWVTQMILRDGVVYAGANGDGGHWFDGRFAADFKTGNLVWLDNCYGSTSDVSVMGEIMYFVSHAHDCASVGSFPEETPTIWRRLMGNTIYATGTDQAPRGSNSLYSGQPTPTQLHWYPSINTGFYTNQFQGGWAMDNNGTKIVVGGEFTTVNGVKQQGLAVFGSRTVAPNKVRPEYTTDMKPTAVSLEAGSVRIGWPTTWDYDDENLTYELLRDNSLTPIATLQEPSTWWKVKSLGYVDTARTAGATHTYRVRVKDPAGNEYIGPRSDPVTVGTGVRSPYADLIAKDGATAYYPLNESGGNSFIDNIGFNDATAGTGLTRGVDGFMPSTTATRFDGTAGASGATRTSEAGPDKFTVEAWIRTSTTTGGKIIGFGNARTGNSTKNDRHVYMSNDGRINFGVYSGATTTLRSAGTYNDGKWHLITASLGTNGMTLYIDGVREATRTDVTAGQVYRGYWRIGGDNLSGWPDLPTTNRFAGDIDEVALYPAPLDRSTVLNHFNASGRTAAVPPAPTDAYGKAIDQDDPSLFWRLDDSGQGNAADASGWKTEGLVTGNVTREAAGVVGGAGVKAFTFDGTNAMTAANKSVVNPRVYTMEAWFKTDTTRGGKIIGFGNKNTGLSTSYDRHVYMDNSGKLIFGTYTGVRNNIQTPSNYNDNQWHHVVASQSSQGMKLYVDGDLVGTNPQTGAQSYTGYWRIGGDTTWGSSSAYLKGSIDEVAVYPHELSQDRVKAHFEIVAPPAPAPASPTASFTARADDLTATFDGAASSSPNGAITTYSWSFGDGTTATGVAPSHKYAAAGSYEVRLTVTDAKGIKASAVQTVAVSAAPVASPALVAAFEASAKGRSVGVDATASTGDTLTYAWNFGDGTTGTGATATHRFTADGEYAVVLTVTDAAGRKASATKLVTAKNTLPSSSFTSVVTGLEVSVDAAKSVDAESTALSYSWSFGDGSTATGGTAKHTYAAAGTYAVALVVRDEDGGEARSEQQVTVTQAPSEPRTFARDAFSRVLSSNWGTADEGGAYSYSGSLANFSVANGKGQIRMGTAGAGPSVFMNSVSSVDTEVSARVSLDKAATGGGVHQTFLLRDVSGVGAYSAKLQFQSNGSVSAFLLRGGTSLLNRTVIPSLGYTPGTELMVRGQVVGSSPTTLRLKVWAAGSAEPASWQLSASDATAEFQKAGRVGFTSYLSGTATNAPVLSRYDDLWVGEAR